MSEESQNDKVTLAIISNELKHWTKAISDLTEELRVYRVATNDRMNDMKDDFDRRLAEKADLERVEKIEEWMKWAGRIIIGAVFLAVIGSVIVNKTAAPAPQAQIASR